MARPQLKGPITVQTLSGGVRTASPQVVQQHTPTRQIVQSTATVGHLTQYLKVIDCQ